MNMRYALIFLIACGGQSHKPDPMKGEKTESSLKTAPNDGGVDAAPWKLDHGKLSAACKSYDDALEALKACAKATPDQKQHVEDAFYGIVRSASSPAQVEAEEHYCTENVEALRAQVTSLGC